MNKLEVFTGITIGHRAVPLTRDSCLESTVQNESADLTTVILHIMSLFTFVASSVALIIVLSFYLTVGNRQPAKKKATIDQTLDVIAKELSKPHRYKAASSPIAQSIRYMLPADFETLQSDENKARDLENYYAQVNFISQLIELNNRHADPRILARVIVNESRRLGYDPLFVTAVIKAESRFDKKAVSNKGALGLMQLLPSTAKYISSKLQSTKWKGTHSLLSDEAYNIKLGIAYLKYLDRKFAGNKNHTLVAYNWGPGNMNRALKDKSSIPSVSRKYRDSILTNYSAWSDKYKQLKATLALADRSASVG